MVMVCLVYIPSRQPESHRLLKSSVYFKHFFELSLEVSLKVWALGSQGARPVTLPAAPSTPLLLLHLNTRCLVLTCMEPPPHCYPDNTYQS